MNDITVAHDENDPCYDPVLAAKYDSAVQMTADDYATPDSLSETSTVSATETDIGDTTNSANRRTMSEGFRQEKVANFVTRQLLTRGHCSQHRHDVLVSRSLTALTESAIVSQRCQQLNRSVSDVGLRASVTTSASTISGLSASTLKLLGLNSQNGSATTSDAVPHILSSAGVADSLCHDDLLLTMAKRLNDAAARSSRSSTVTPDSIETPQHRLSDGKEMPLSEAECGNLHRSQQTDGPPYTDSDDEATDNSTCYEYTSSDEVHNSVAVNSCSTGGSGCLKAAADSCDAKTSQSDDNDFHGSSFTCDPNISQNRKHLSSSFKPLKPSSADFSNPHFSTVESQSLSHVGMQVPKVILHNVLKSGLVISEDGKCQLSGQSAKTWRSLAQSSTASTDDAVVTEQNVANMSAKQKAAVSSLSAYPTSPSSTYKSAVVPRSSAWLDVEAGVILVTDTESEQNAPTKSVTDLATLSSLHTAASTCSPPSLLSAAESGSFTLSAIDSAADTLCTASIATTASVSALSVTEQNAATVSVVMSSSVQGTISACSSPATHLASAALFCNDSVSVASDTTVVAMATTMTPVSTSSVGELSFLSTAECAVATLTNVLPRLEFATESDTQWTDINTIAGGILVESESESSGSLCEISTSVASISALPADERTPLLSATENAASALDNAAVPLCTAAAMAGTTAVLPSLLSPTPAPTQPCIVSSSGIDCSDSSVQVVISAFCGSPTAVVTSDSTVSLSAAVSVTLISADGQDSTDGGNDDNFDNVSVAAEPQTVAPLPKSSSSYCTVSTESESETYSVEVFMPAGAINLITQNESVTSEPVVVGVREVASQATVTSSPTATTATVSSTYDSRSISLNIPQSTLLHPGAKETDIQVELPWSEIVSYGNDFSSIPATDAMYGNSSQTSTALAVVSVTAGEIQEPVTSCATAATVSCTSQSIVSHSSELSVSFTSSSSFPAVTQFSSVPSQSAVIDSTSQITVNALCQLLASAKHSQPYFICVVPAAKTAASPVVVSKQQAQLTAYDHSYVLSSPSSDDRTQHNIVPERLTIPSTNYVASLSDHCKHSEAVSSTRASTMKRILLGEDEPTTATKRVRFGSDTVPILIDGWHHVDYQGTPLASPTAHQSGYRLAQAVTSTSDLWTRPDQGQGHPGNTSQQCPMPHIDYQSTQAGDLQITLRPTASSLDNLPHAGAQVTGGLRTQHGTQLQDFGITLQPGTQASVLTDRSNHSMELPRRGRLGHKSTTDTEHLHKWSSSFGQTPNPLPQKQSFWDRPGILLDCATFETSLTSAFQLASYLAAMSRHSVVARAFAAAGIPVCKEPTGLSRTYGKRPDGMTLIPWWAGKPAVWDVTVICTSARSYLNSSACEAGAAAEFAASHKTAKYVRLAASYIFFPIVVETREPLSEEALQLLCDLGRRISASSGDDREISFSFQRISVVVQHFNAVLLHDSFCVEYQPD